MSIPFSSRRLSGLIISGLILFQFSCTKAQVTKPDEPVIAAQDTVKAKSILFPDGNTLTERFRTPAGFTRVAKPANSFSTYLASIPLKKYGAPIRTYDGDEIDGGYHLGVFDLPIGTKDLHQCADAVMRVRADYLYSQKRYDEIHFNFTNGMRVDYSEWMKGKRISVSGNKTTWKLRASPANTPDILWKYLEQIFMYAGTLSLSKELKSKPLEAMQIGDVLIQGGSPGHAMLIIDMAVDEKSGQKLYMLAQSYMPAQEFHILTNPEEPLRSPWYTLEAGNSDIPIQTPSWTFYSTDLKSF